MASTQGGIDGLFAWFGDKFKFRFLGLGFLWAWIYCTWFTPTVFPTSSGPTVNNDVSWIISLTAVMLTLFII